MMLRFILLGASDCPNRSAITHSQLKTWETQGIITYAGESSDVREFIESCSCVVLPSYREGVPMSLLEAMSMGKPIITTNVSGCKECIKPPFIKKDNVLIGQNGILIPPKDSKSLVNAMEILQNLSRAQLAQMGNMGRQYVIDRFSKTRIINHYKEIVSHLTKPKNLI